MTILEHFMEALACAKNRKTMCNNKFKTKKGYITLISMLIIGAVGVSILVTNILLSVGSTKTSIVLTQLQKAKMAANACAEEALGNIWKDNSYEGSGNLTFLIDSNCSYSVSGDSISKTISATGTSGSVTRNVSVGTDQLNPYINISFWQEVE